MAKLKAHDGDYELQEGYRLEKIIQRLTYPANIEFDLSGRIYLTEAGFTYPFFYKTATIWRLNGKEREKIAEGFHGPLVGLKWHDNGFLVTHRGTLSRVELDGKVKDLVTGIPSYGDHHTNHIVIKDEKVYFGQGTATNAAVVGLDNLVQYGWLATHREGHDTPPYDITLTGLNFKSRDPFNPLKEIETGAFCPIGKKGKPGQVVKGQLKSNGVVYRCNPDGSELEVFAWGFRNPYALAIDPKGRLLAINQGGDNRGSRPIHSEDDLYEVKQGAWYGWPDYWAGKPVTDWKGKVDTENPFGFVMQDHPKHEKPLHKFTEHSAAVSIDFSSNEDFGFVGEAFIAEYGSGAPFTTGGKMISTGHKIVRLNMQTMKEENFYVNKNLGPGGDAPERPVMAKFSPDGKELYVVDHGLFGTPATGSLWKITKE